MLAPDSGALTAQLATSLQTHYSLRVSPLWLANFLSAQRVPLPPLPALTSTAHFRLLNSDFTASLSSVSQASLFPPAVGDVNVKERKLAGNVPVQVLDIEDIGTSKWSQLEAIERIEKGEEVRGREVIRTLPSESSEREVNGDPTNARATDGAMKFSGPHKLILQDAAGTQVAAFELERVPKLEFGDQGIHIGAKLMLKNGTLVRRGMVMLEPVTVIVLGGKVEAWDKQWQEGRKERLSKAFEGEPGVGNR